MLMLLIAAISSAQDVRPNFGVPTLIGYMNLCAQGANTASLAPDQGYLTPHTELGPQSVSVYDAFAYRTNGGISTSEVHLAIFATGSDGGPSGDVIWYDNAAPVQPSNTPKLSDFGDDGVIVDPTKFDANDDLLVYYGDVIWLGYARTGGGTVNTYVIPTTCRRSLGHDAIGASAFSGFEYLPSSWTGWPTSGTLSTSDLIVNDGNAPFLALQLVQ